MKIRVLLLLCLSIVCLAATAQVRAIRDTVQHDTLVRRYVLAGKDTSTATAIPADLDWHPLKVSKFKALNQSQNYRTWNVGINAGILSPFLVIGGNNNFTNVNIRMGYGISIRKQLIHQLGFQFDAITGTVSAMNQPYYKGNASSIRSFSTNLAYSTSLSGIVQIGSLDVFRHRNAVNFFITAGCGFIGFAPTVTYANGDVIYYEGHVGFTREKNFVHELTTLVGIGAKYRISDRLTLNGGYTANFVDDDFFDGTYGNTFVSGTTAANNTTSLARGSRKQKFSYGYMGLEVSIGKRSKPNIDWISTTPTIFERQRDSARVDSTLQVRMLSFQKRIDSLKRDADGDGVPDYFDKCPNTPKSTAVDGSGCPIIIGNTPDSLMLAKLKRIDTIMNVMVNPPIVYPIIVYDYDSAIIPHSYFPELDAVAKDLRDHPAKKVVVHGYASSEGHIDHNISLSRARAQAVKDYLVTNGVPADQISIKGLGETNPRANNSVEQGRMLNRRAVFE